MQNEAKLTYPRVYVTYQESSNINATSHTLEGLIIYKIIHTKFAGGRSRMHSILISCQSILSLFSGHPWKFCLKFVGSSHTNLILNFVSFFNFFFSSIMKILALILVDILKIMIDFQKTQASSSPWRSTNRMLDKKDHKRSP